MPQNINIIDPSESANQINEVVSLTPKSKHSRSRNSKLTPYRRSRNNFLTDTQTSDNTTTKSNDCNPMKMKIMQEKIKKLSKQNAELKQVIIQMKANQFYTINQEKVKQAITDNEKLRRQLKMYENQIEELKIQNQFLERNNKNLKDRLQSKTEDILRKSIGSNSRGKLQNSRRQIRQIKLLNNQRKNRNSDPEQNQQNNVIATYNEERRVLIETPNRVLNQVRSNPNLLLGQKDQRNIIQIKSNKQNIQTSTNLELKSRTPKQILKNSNHNQVNLQSRTGQYYYRQTPNNITDNHDNSNSMTISQQRQPIQNGLLSPRNQQRNSNKYGKLSNANVARSKSKQINLHTFLMQKNQMLNGKKVNSNNNYNEEYFIGKTMNSNTPNIGSLTAATNSGSSSSIGGGYGIGVKALRSKSKKHL